MFRLRALVVLLVMALISQIPYGLEGEGHVGSPGKLSRLDGSFNDILAVDDDLLFINDPDRTATTDELILGPVLIDPSHAGTVEMLPVAGLRNDQYIIQVPEEGPSTDMIEQFDVKILDILSRSSLLMDSRFSGDIGHIEESWGLRGVYPYHAVMVVDASLYFDLLDDEEGTGSYRVVAGSYVRWEDMGPDVMEIIDSFDPYRIDQWTFALTMSRDQVASLAAWPTVSHISKILMEDLDNDVAADIIGVKEGWKDPGLDGSGQIIAVADTGLDTGSNSTLHPDMKGRIESAYPYGRTGNWSDPDIHVWDASTGSWNYKGGHGTHVVGSVLGNGSASGGNHSGMAPKAKLVMQSTMNSAGSLSIPAYSRLFEDAYNSGARIQTNSWSSRSSYANYTWKSWQTDNYLWSQKDLLVLFSAGNKGTSGPYMVSTQASSKNVIAVGASESYRPSVSSSANNISQIAYFSSQGYTWGDNRIKPDVVAPGTYILSTRASTITDFWNHYWGSNATYVGVNDRYAYMGGTSMSTPIVAGMSALVRQYFQEEEAVSNPSSALLKASIINGARPLDGDWSSIPNRYEGWGLVNISNSIATNDSDAGELFFVDNSTGLSTGGSHSRNITVSGGSTDLVMTLVWTDYPGSNTSSTKLVNDLDLLIKAPNGTVYHGNDLLFPYNSTRDRNNNVERIRIPVPRTGIYEVTVEGYSVTKGPQPYAIVATFEKPGKNGVLSFENGHVPANGSVSLIRLSDIDLTGSTSVYVTINSTTDPTGEKILMKELKDDGVLTGIFEGSFGVTTGTPGSGDVKVSGDEEIRAYYEEDDPKRTLFVVTGALVVPEIRSITHLPSDTVFTFQDNITVILEGTKDSSVHFTIAGMDGGSMVEARDNGVLPDVIAGDGNYTGSVIVPSGLMGNLTLTGYIIRPDLHPQSKVSDLTVDVNTEIPRRPRNLVATPLPMGNSIEVKWNVTGDSDIISYAPFIANESIEGSGEPGSFRSAGTVPGGRRSIEVYGLEDGEEYFFFVAAIDSQGYISSPSQITSGIPSDTKGPWVEWISPISGSVLSGEVEVDISLENDTERLIIQGAADSNSDGVPDGLWLDLLDVFDPINGIIWDTTNLKSSIWEGKDVLLRIRAMDERLNTNITDVLLTVGFDNTPPSSFRLTSQNRLIQNDSVYHLTGETEPMSRILVTSDSGRAFNGVSDQEGGVDMMIVLESGENLFEIKVFDRYGNGPLTADNKLIIVLDNIPPDVTMSWTGNRTSETTYLSAEGTFDPDQSSDLTGISSYQWIISYGDEIITKRGSRVFIEPEIPGIYRVTLRVQDNAMNMVEMTRDMVVADGIEPELMDLDDRELEEDSLLEVVPGLIDDDPDIHTNGIFKWEISGPESAEHQGIVLETILETPGDYDVKLTVTDTGGNSDSAEFSVHVIDITPPVANAGSDMTVLRGDIVNISGILSTDNDPSFPAGSIVEWKVEGMDVDIRDFEGSFEAYLLGDFIVRLKVTDGSGNLAEDSFKLKVGIDGVAPTVSGSFPLEGSIGFDPEDPIIVQFSERMDTGSAWEHVHILDGYDDPVGYSISWSEDGTSMILKPSDPLDRGSEYHVSIDGGLTDRTGTEIDPTMISFSVRERLQFVSFYPGPVEWVDENSWYMERDPGPIYIEFTDNLINGSVISISSKDGSFNSELAMTGNGNRNYSIAFPEGIEPGNFVMSLSGLVSAHGENISGEESIFLIIIEKEDDSEGSWFIPLLLICILVIFLFGIISGLYLLGRKRSSGKEIVSGDLPHVMASDLHPEDQHSVFHSMTGNDKY